MSKKSYFLQLPNLYLQKIPIVLDGCRPFNDDQAKETRKIPPTSMISSDERTKILTIPNSLCLSRICTAPIISYLIVDECYGFASFILIISAFTDMLDGFIARRFPSQRSPFGSLLDPVADKFLVNATFLTLAYVHLIPVPLATIVLLRDVLLALGVVLFRHRTLDHPKSLRRFFDSSVSPFSVTPTNISKANTVLQFASLTSCLICASLDITDLDRSMLDILYALTGTTTVISGIQYATGKELKLER